MTTEERLANLELQLVRVKRRNRLLMSAVLVVAGGLVFPLIFETTAYRARAQGGGAVEEIRAKRIVVEDETGMNRMVLGLIENGPALELYDKNGKTHVFLKADEGGSSLMLSDDKGELRFSLTVNNDRRSLMFYNDKGKISAVLGSYEDGPSLSLHDEDGGNRVWMTAFKAGPALIMLDEKSQARFSAGISETTSPEGKTTKYPESSLILFGPDGKVIWSAIK